MKHNEPWNPYTGQDFKFVCIFERHCNNISLLILLPPPNKCHFLKKKSPSSFVATVICVRSTNKIITLSICTYHQAHNWSIKEKIVQTLNIVVCLKHHIGILLLGQSHKHSTSQRASLFAKFLAISTVNVQLRRTSTIIRNSTV